MRRKTLLAALALFALALPAVPVDAAAPTDELQDICADLYGGVYATPTAEPLAGCQWDMAVIEANDSTFANATGAGARVGVIDSGVDRFHPDIAPNLDLDASCSFIFDDTPTALPVEVANGDCTNKAAVQDYGDHGTHVASTIAAPINGIGIAGVAPEATIVALKACTAVGYCFADSVAAALRYAGDQRLDIVNLSLFADPYLYYCGNNAEQRAIYKDLKNAAKYAQQRGVLIIAAAGNEASDLRHPGIDAISPDWPPGSEEVRDVGNNCRVAPTELPGVVAVMSTGPLGYPDYSLNIADLLDGRRRRRCAGRRLLPGDRYRAGRNPRRHVVDQRSRGRHLGFLRFPRRCCLSRTDGRRRRGPVRLPQRHVHGLAACGRRGRPHRR